MSQYSLHETELLTGYREKVYTINGPRTNPVTEEMFIGRLSTFKRPSQKKEAEACFARLQEQEKANQ